MVRTTNHGSHINNRLDLYRHELEYVEDPLSTLCNPDVKFTKTPLSHLVYRLSHLIDTLQSLLLHQRYRVHDKILLNSIPSLYVTSLNRCFYLV